MMETLNAGLATLILALAVWTIVARDGLAAVAGFIAYGLLLTLAWVQLSGVDVALTEAAIGGGLTGALLIGAAARLRDTEAAARAERPGVLTRALGALVAGAVTVALAICVLTLPDPAPTLAPDVAANIGATGVGNPITAVLLAFRAMDTLLEAIVLLFALIGVWSLAPDRAWGGRPGPRHLADPNGILAYIARVLPPIGIIVGMYIFWVGADHPGGKFQGATILAAMWLLVMMAGLTDAPPISRAWLRIGLVAGPLVFIAIGLVGAASAGAFLAYPDGYAKPLIVVIELALMPSLALVLALMLAGAPQRMAQPDTKGAHR
jgi:multisubunit Na+/H+ antiporter MnhB subunit